MQIIIFILKCLALGVGFPDMAEPAGRLRRHPRHGLCLCHSGLTDEQHAIDPGRRAGHRPGAGGESNTATHGLCQCHR